ncbi:MAG: glycosyltransferase family 4 protein [Candidatus Nanopelagicales bacterium]|nr:glycosyltransferase family 4 protein [Candidatus Nanopelagicales bacterium]MDZ4249173.1 glycosyltransferase family 4 protein [Candidatus Nanopelagicales bacterium]MDZ7579009.1 glycosyltransferase family 4 protein [Candidatus Nanopelagicales bacterium]
MPKSLRVGIVSPYAWDVPGGVQFHIRDLTQALERLGHHVSVLAPADEDDGLPDYVTSTGRPMAVHYNGSVARVNLGVRSTRRVRQWVRDGEFHVMHVHEPMCPGISNIAIWAAQGPIVATWHSSMERSRALSASFYLAQTIMEKVRGRIAVSELARRTLVDHLGGDAVLIPNGVDCGAFEDAEPFEGWPGPGRALLFLGRLDEPRKGLSILLKALPAIAERFPDIRLLLAGPGDESDIVRHLPEDVRRRLTFLGLVSESDKVRAMHSVDAYVAPNTGGESFGIVLLEAMASGTPVVASDLEAFRRVLDEGRDGVQFANGDSADLARAAVGLLGDDARRAELEVAGRARAKLYDWERVSREIVDVYRSVRVPGEHVSEDLRGQFVGRFAHRAAWRPAGGRE